MPTKPGVTRKCLVNGCENRIVGDEDAACVTCGGWFAIWEALAAEVKKKEREMVGVYGNWCHDPKLCAGKSYCPRDPTCAD